MYDFSLGVLEILESIKTRSLDQGIHTVGSEFLLLEMMKIEDGIFRFLMTEYDVKEQEVIDETNKLLVLRKESGIFSSSLENIFESASKVTYGKIKEEHLLYGILETKDSIANKILLNLGLSTNDLLLDLKEIYDFKTSDKEDTKFTTNITEKARRHELDGLFEYDNYLKKLIVILNKKYKNNPIIIGEAGVGKTALVEGLALYSIKHNLDYEILTLNLSQMLSNTKYRGDFEARIEETLNYIKEHKNTILFIDEIHTIVGAGSTENSLDVANILKPFLARSDIKIIGATTSEEYHKTIFKDKALRRRFDPVMIKEPDLDTTKKIMKGLKPSYEKFHKIEIEDDLLEYLILESDKGILNKSRPDKCIDILDESMSFAHCNNKKMSKEIIDSILEEHIGFKKDKNSLIYYELNKLEFLKENNLKEQSNYNYNIACFSEDNIKGIKQDLMTLFGINDEMILELDLKQYPDHASIQTLIGAPPGYVGYHEEGLMSRQITKHPLSLLILKNFESMSISFKNIYDRIINDGFFYDNAGNKIYTKHVILLNILKHEEFKRLGFTEEHKRLSKEYDVIIDRDIINNKLNYEYEKIFKKYNLDLKLKFDVLKKHRFELNNIIYDLLEHEDNSPHEIVLQDSLVTLLK